jgi:photosystem II stability/assembly factor-like uncharacterized protein
MTRDEKKNLSSLIWKMENMIKSIETDGALQKDADGGYTHNAMVARLKAKAILDDLQQSADNGRLQCDREW